MVQHRKPQHFNIPIIFSWWRGKDFFCHEIMIILSYICLLCLYYYYPNTKFWVKIICYNLNLTCNHYGPCSPQFKKKKNLPVCVPQIGSCLQEHRAEIAMQQFSESTGFPEGSHRKVYVAQCGTPLELCSVRFQLYLYHKLESPAQFGSVKNCPRCEHTLDLAQSVRCSGPRLVIVCVSLLPTGAAFKSYGKKVQGEPSNPDQQPQKYSNIVQTHRTYQWVCSTPI